MRTMLGAAFVFLVKDEMSLRVQKNNVGAGTIVYVLSLEILSYRKLKLVDEDLLSRYETTLSIGGCNDCALLGALRDSRSLPLVVE